MQLEDQAERAFGLRAAFEIFCRLEPHPAPPFEVFEQSYDQDWFQQAFSSRVVLVGEEPTLEALRTIQTSYLEHFRTAKALKRDRTSLIVLALREGFSAESVLDASEQSIYDLYSLSELEGVPDSTWSEIEALKARQDGVNSQKRVLTKGASNEVEAEWLNDHKTLKAWRRQCQVSKKKYGDEWFGCDFTEEELARLKCGSRTV